MPVLTLVRAQRQRAAGFAFIVAGALAVVVGSVSISSSSTPEEQLSYLVSAGLGGLLCLGIGVTALLEAGLRDEQQKLAELAEASRSAAPASRVENGFTVGGTVPPLVAVALGTVLVGIGWNQSAAASDEGGAVTGLATGIAGLVLVAAMAVVRLLGMQAAVERLKAAVLRPLADRYQSAIAVDLTTAPPADAPDARDPGTVLVAPGLTRFHQTGCPTLIDVDPTAVHRSDVDPGLRPCQLCEAANR